MSKLAAFLGEDLKEDEVFDDDELRCWYSPSKKQTVLIKDMETVYILNCIKMLNGQGKTEPSKEVLAKKDIFLKWFNEELNRRNS